MAKTLKLDVQRGRIEVPEIPGEGATDEQKSERTLALVGELKAELPEIEKLLETAPREAIVRLWVLRSYLDAHPVRWIRNYAQRKEWNDLAKRLEELRDQAGGALEEGKAKQMWEDLPFARDTLQLLWGKLRAQGEVLRLILSPLGKLQFAKIRYQREGPEDLSRVCREIEESLAGGADMDGKVTAWGEPNLTALLAAAPPTQLPPALTPKTGPGVGILVVGVLLLAGGGALLGTNAAAGAGLLVVGLVLAGLGGANLAGALKRKGALPGEFVELGSRFRERLYLTCCLRGLYQLTSRFTRASDALDSYQKEHGGAPRWKRVKLEEKDLTQVFASGTEAWHPKETIESWLSAEVTKAFRLDSQSLAAQGDIDPEAWEMIYRAYQLASDDHGVGGKHLDVVAELLFIKRGENTEAERKRVFAELRAAAQAADRERATR
jgi:hypothetical protein